MPQSTEQSSVPALCIDVDGTLLRTDLLFESLLCLTRSNPWLLFCVPFWLMRGKAWIKRRLAQYISPGSRTFPVHESLLQLLKTETQRGRYLVLCSGSDERLIHQVATQLDMRFEVIASNGAVNLTGEGKARALVARFGAKGFDYVGNASDDLPVWCQARHAILVNASAKVQEAAQKRGNVILVLPRRRRRFSAVIRALRVYQWVKNALVFFPLLTSHKIFEGSLVLNSALLFFAMSCCASSVYVVNDLLDIESDRRHPSKRNRPFANGDLSIPAGLVLAPLLFGLGILLSVLLPKPVLVMLLLYTTLATAYTFCLKRKLIADVVALGLLYTTRIVAGGTATSILVSPWLLAFSLFLFLSFAFSKRVAEIIRVSATDQHRAAGRGYVVADTPTLATLGACSGFLASLVLTFYINSDSVRLLYPHPAWLWLLLPLLLYWIGRIWILTMRGRMHDDPILFVFKDLATYLTFAWVCLILLLATKCPFGIPGVVE